MLIYWLRNVQEFLTVGVLEGDIAPREAKNGYIMKNCIIACLLLLAGQTASAQTGVIDGSYYGEEETYPTRTDYTMDFPTSVVRDSPYDQYQRRNTRAVRYAPVREADVMWSKRIWRKIDLREKMNHALYFPTQPLADRQSLFDVMVYNMLYEGTITPYDPGPLGDTDDFSIPMSRHDLAAKLVSTDTVMVENLTTGAMEPVAVENRIESKDITHYVVKEDWFFDSKRSMMDVRILGIAPVRAAHADDGSFKGYELLFWVYYPEARMALSTANSYNRGNDHERRSFEEVFRKRMFSSVIVKESNVYDRYIAEYKTGLNALLEAEGIREDMFNYEQDMWSW